MELIEGVAEIEDVDRLVERVSDIGAEHGCVITAFDARYLVGREHIKRATRLAKRAFEREENVADDRAIEVLLYAAGRRQIDRAIEIGVSAGECLVVVYVEQADGNWERRGRGDTDDSGDDEGTETTDDDCGVGAAGTTDDADADDAEEDGPEWATAAAVERALGPAFERRTVLGEYDEGLVRDFFGVTEAELTATDAGLAALVGERVTLLDVEK